VHNNRLHLPSRLLGGASTLLVRMKDVVLRLEGDVAPLSAVLKSLGVGAELVLCRVVVIHSVPSAAGFRKFLTVLFHHENLFKAVGHIDYERRFRAFLRLHWSFTIIEPCQISDIPFCPPLGPFRSSRLLRFLDGTLLD
jgi:hypothetical protein